MEDSMAKALGVSVTVVDVDGTAVGQLLFGDTVVFEVGLVDSVWLLLHPERRDELVERVLEAFARKLAE